MRLAVYAEDRKEELLPLLTGRQGFGETFFYRSYDDFLSGLPQSNSRCILIAQKGAGGMEAVRAARILCPSTPLIWLSNDRGFGPESWRLGCKFFSAEPLSEALITRALAHCNLSDYKNEKEKGELS